MMNDYPYISATEARKSFSETIDNAVYHRPQFIKRTRNNVVVMGQELVNRMLNDLKLILTVEEDNGLYIVYSETLEGVLASASDREEAIEAYCRELDEYAHEYYDNFELYSNSPNRKHHLPYILRIACSSSLEDLKGMLECQPGKN